MAGRRVAVLGGGMASLVTLLKLTDQPGWEQQFEFDLYQMGWRLGGKGASGRLQHDLPDGGSSHRIVEHGLHVLFGFYENSFRVLRPVFEEAARAHGWPWAFDDALKPKRALLMYEKLNDQWLPWPMRMRPLPGIPGIPGRFDTDSPSLDYYLKALLRLIVAELLDALSGSDERFAALAPTAAEQTDEPDGASEAWVARVLDSDLAREKASEIPWSLLFRLLALLRPGAWRREPLPRLFDALGSALDELLHPYTDGAYAAGAGNNPAPAEHERRRQLLQLRLAVTLAVGMARDLPPVAGDWFALDRWDFRDWLRQHGAPETVIRSPLVDGLYDGAYSYQETFGAGTCLHALIESQLGRKGWPIYEMQAGMGDVIFAPIYRVLAARGVRFHFFHRVDALRLDASRTRIAGIELGIQATTVNGAPYDPLLTLDDGLWAWPAEPRHEQLADPDTARAHNFENWWDTHAVQTRTLRRETDFDDVILGISVGAFQDICRELIEDTGNPRFALMVSSINTTLTQSAQLWFEPTLARLGYGGPSPITIPFEAPFDTWSDMSHLIEREAMPATGSIAYLTSSMADDEPPPPRGDAGYPERQRQRVLASLRTWLSRSAQVLWPASHDASGFDWQLLRSVNGFDGPQRLDDQWTIAADNPSDRYNLAVRGSSAMRLRADESGYDNLVLAGDWTRTALGVGCLEAATMSGITAARVLDPRVPRAVHDWLPDAYVRKPASGFVLRDGAMLTPPPVALEVRAWAFALDADHAALQALCDRELGLAPGYAYRPASRALPLVIFYASQIDNLVPGGSVPELDFGFWIPLLRTGPDGRQTLVTYTPNLWVDSSPALINGMTVFGFPKQLGRMTVPPSIDVPGRFTLDATVQPLQGHPVADLRLLELEPGESAPAAAARGSRLAELMRALEAGVGGKAEWLAAAELFQAGGMRQVFLKQLLAADGSFAAAHQSLLEADLPLDQLRAFRWLGDDWSLRIRRTFSHDIVRNLGLRGGVYETTPWPSHRLPVRFAFALEFLGSVQPATLIHPQA